MRHALATLRCGSKERPASLMRVREDVGRWWRPGCVRRTLGFHRTSSDERCQRQALYPSMIERRLRWIQDGSIDPPQQCIRYARLVAYSSLNQERNPWPREYFRYPFLPFLLPYCIQLNYTSRPASQLIPGSNYSLHATKNGSYQDAVSISDAEFDYTSD